MLPRKKVILCADDYGISPSVNKSICLLAKRKRISATSVMVVYDDWNIHNHSLIENKGSIDIGLHFVLTDSCPVSPTEKIPSLLGKDGKFLKMKTFMRRSWIRKIRGNEVYEELTAQFNRFVENFGFQPEFIDGHHNAHQYPMVRDVVVRFIERNNLKNKLYIRNTAHRWKAVIGKPDWVKTTCISFFGFVFKKKLLAHGLQTNESFGGVYDLTHSSDFENKFKNFLLFADRKNAIIMIHPGKSDSTLEERDSFNKGREIEENFLLQDSFLELLNNQNIILGKYHLKEVL